jgi:hypothetical protein
MRIRYSWTTRNTDKTPPPITPTGPWTPDRMVNIIAWFDPANGVTQSSGSVSDWGDVFGWGATQPTAGTRLVWSSTQVNGFPGFANNGSFTGFLTVPNLAANVPRTVVTLASAPSAATNTTFTASGIGGSALTIGGCPADATYWAGSFGDVILTGDYNNTSEIQKAEGYLAWKYSLSSLLPGGHPYASAPP